VIVTLEPSVTFTPEPGSLDVTSFARPLAVSSSTATATRPFAVNSFVASFTDRPVTVGTATCGLPVETTISTVVFVSTCCSAWGFCSVTSPLTMVSEVADDAFGTSPA